MIKNFLKGVNVKKFSITVLVMFVYIFITDMIIHTFIMGDIYQQTSQLWRSQVEMQSMMWVMFLGQLIIAKYFTFIFVKGYEGKGWREGARFGALMGLLNIGGVLIQYSVTPLTSQILCYWIVLGFIQAVVGGMVVAKTYKK